MYRNSKDKDCLNHKETVCQVVFKKMGL